MHYLCNVIVFYGCVTLMLYLATVYLANEGGGSRHINALLNAEYLASDCDHMLVGFTTTCAISAHHH